MSTTGTTLALWRKLAKLPLGTRIFSWGVSWRAPYFRTIRPHITELRPGYCEVHAAKRRRVHNHIGTFHAIAACNMAEVAAGVLTEASIPTTHRWIPTGMTVRYVAKAATDLRAVAELDPLPAADDTARDWVVPVRILDTADKTVVTADITMRVSPRKSRTTAAKTS
ncbi:hotdog fold domain-containing protein [Saccharopolyspora taberi]|uniref:Hotdog fold domain-containing protein n=1 Tax=Saccharopolyspora taberi TaxID=60895 RepID=A0ABN3VBG4_9PSEU